MKKTLLVLAVLAMSVPAMAGVVLTVTDLGGGVAEISYVSDVNVSGFGLDITVSAGTITGISNYFVGECDTVNKGYGIFPASFARVIDAADPNWNDAGYTPVADACDTGALGGIGTAGITIEMGALYEAGNNPAKSGVLCELTVGETCNMTVAVNGDRGVALEGGAAASVTGDTTLISLVTYPECWDYATQCHGDTDNNATVDTVDWPQFRDGFGKTYPDAAYKPCADFNRDGTIDTVDWPAFRDNFGKTPASDCTPGDPYGIY